MDNKVKLIDLLSQYIDQNKKLKAEREKLRANISLYEELFNLLEADYDFLLENSIMFSILLDTIYNNDIYSRELYRILLEPGPSRKNFRNFVKKIKSEYEVAKENLKNIIERMNRNRDKVNSAYNVRLCLIKNIPILKSKFDIKNVINIINYFEMAGIISSKDALLLINEIELYNRKVGIKSVSSEERAYLDSLYDEIPNIIMAGFQEHDVIEVQDSKRETLDKFVKEILNMISYLDKEQIIENIEVYKKYGLEINEFNYIIVRLLDEYLDELMFYYQSILDKDIHSNRLDRIEVTRQYYNVLEIYVLLRNYYNKINEYVVVESEEESPELILEQEKEERHLIYSHSNLNVIKSRLISDMNDIAYEYYQEIYDLITKFKDGTLSKKKIKPILNGSNNDGNYELKDDDIRIVLKRISGNVYTIQGVFIKKDNNDTNMYRRIINRPLPEINSVEDLAKYMELSKIIDSELEKLVNEKARVNGRK